ncbi:hypothetical protein IAR55_000542 [Kwoniella newhampshirensis]|uniref:Uncharacterized protein n=1 Tax=Kwoniella newhampshirensis TaxID=1651941 RepID=A0AAW0Z6Y6_9TREE
MVPSSADLGYLRSGGVRSRSAMISRQCDQRPKDITKGSANPDDQQAGSIRCDDSIHNGPDLPVELWLQVISHLTDPVPHPMSRQDVKVPIHVSLGRSKLYAEPVVDGVYLFFRDINRPTSQV